MKHEYNSESDTYNENLQRLQEYVNRTFGRVVTSVADFEMLSDEIKLSVQSLRRFYQKIDTNKKLSQSSLNLICNYVGFSDWQRFCKGELPPPIRKLLMYSRLSTIFMIR